MLYNQWSGNRREEIGVVEGDVDEQLSYSHQFRNEGQGTWIVTSNTCLSVEGRWLARTITGAQPGTMVLFSL